MDIKYLDSDNLYIRWSVTKISIPFTPLHMAACRTMMQGMRVVVLAHETDVVVESKDSSNPHYGEGGDERFL